MKILGNTSRRIVVAVLALSGFAVVPSVAQTTDEAVRAAVTSGSSARVIMQFATTAERDAAFDRLLDRGAAVRVTDTEAGPALVVLGSAAAFGDEVAVASQTSLDAKVRVSATQTPARASTSAALRAKQVLNRQNRIGAADNGGVAVAVIDSGFQPHADLPLGRLRYYRDFVSHSTTPVDGCGHGTHVAGIVSGNGASSPNRKYAGIAPDVELVVLRVLDENCSGNTSDVIDALEWVARHHRAYNIKVVNLSLGHDVLESAFTDPMVQAVERLARKGIAVVTAAGNKGYLADAAGNPVDRQGQPIPVGGTPIRVHGGVGVPCNAPSSICVGSLNTIEGDSNYDNVAFSSSAGPTRFDLLAKPDLVAPGVKIVSLAAPGSRLFRDYPELEPADASGYFMLSGTSMASPAVAAAAALIFEANKNLSANALKMSLQFTSRLLVDADGDAKVDVLTQGAGALNLGGAMTLASSIRPYSVFGAPWLRRSLVASNRDATGRTINWSRRIIYGDRFMNPRYAQIHLVRWEDDIVWGYDTIDDNIVWGNNDNIVWGNGKVRGRWAASLTSSFWDDNIVWGNVTRLNEDNIVWGNDDDNIVWGNAVLTSPGGGR